MDELTFTDVDGVDVFYRRWPVDDARGVVVVAHGLSEHSGRYARFAGVLNDAGYAVYAIDHRGHGRTAESTGPGRAGPRGADGILDDLGQLIDLAVAEVPDVPVVLFGHSMGSLIAQAFVERGRGSLSGYVLSGCPGPPDESLGVLITQVEGAVAAGMGDEPAPSLAMFNEPFEPARTPFDWLSRDPDEVDLYIADPMCGEDMPPTLAFVGATLSLARDAMSADAVQRTPDFPVLLVTGERDPVSAMGAQVRVLEKSLIAAGLDVTAHYYADARHEVLNETNRDEVHGDVVTWLGRIAG